MAVSILHWQSNASSRLADHPQQLGKSNYVTGWRKDVNDISPFSTAGTFILACCCRYDGASTATDGTGPVHPAPAGYPSPDPSHTRPITGRSLARQLGRCIHMFEYQLVSLREKLRTGEQEKGRKLHLL